MQASAHVEAPNESPDAEPHMHNPSPASHAIAAGSGPLADVAQLMLPAIRWSDNGGFEGYRESIELGLRLGVGGFIFFGGTSEAVASMTAELRERSRIPLLIGADLERGAGQQFRGLTGLPPLAAIGSLRDSGDMRRAARLTAREARSVGVNWVYAPSCDLDVEPDNPIIGTRAISGDPQVAAELAAEWIDACQAEGVLACAKHFPGHGRTTTDSHAELPVVDASRETLEREDLLPFRAAVDAGVASVMTAHVVYPALDASGAAATLSQAILGSLLRERMGFEGLVVTDAMIMQGMLEGQDEREAAVRALAAGCDLLLYPTDIEGVARAVVRAVESGRLALESLARSAARRRRWAEWAAEVGTASVTADEREWAAELCRRVVHPLRGSVPSLGAAPHVAIVDDDLGGPYPPPSRQPFLDELKSAGVGPVVVDDVDATSQATLVIALFGDIRSWKGRPGYSGASRDRVQHLLHSARSSGRPAVVVQFSHPRLVSELGEVNPVLCAWGGEASMQRAAARWLLDGGAR